MFKKCIILKSNQFGIMIDVAIGSILTENGQILTEIGSFQTRVSLNLFRYQTRFFFRNSGLNIKKNCFECFWASALKDIIIYHYMCYYIIIRSSNGARCHMLNSYVENMFSLIVLSSDITKITLSSISTTSSFYFETHK